jgi:hypothetical protein
VFIKPWNKESERILRQLSLTGRAYTNDKKFVRAFGCKHKNILDNGFLDIASTNYGKRPDKTLFVTPPEVAVVPKPGERGVNFHFKRFKIL